MKISIITPTYNSVKTISRTIESVILQSYKEIEYIVIDGGSLDGTQDMVLVSKNRLDIKFISEKDSGIYDAMNKGVSMATGDIVGILNSDDFYENESVLLDVIQAFNDEKIDAVYGNISYFSDDLNKVTRYWKAGEYKECNLNNGWIIPHPALFLKKSVYDKCGLFNTDFRVAADYEFILRILKINKINVKYIPKVLVRMYSGGNSGSSFKNRMKGWKDLKMSWKVNDLKIPKFFIVRRILFKISQYYS
jgi:glycosyltransferase